MKRRNFVIGAGTALTSIGGVSSAAFSKVDMERTAQMGVVHDSEGLLALDAGQSDFAHYKDNGEIVFNFSDSSIGGINRGSTIQFGSDSDPTNKYLFKMTNKGSLENNVSMKYTDVDSLPGSNLFTFSIYNESGTKLGDFGVGNEFTFNGMSPNESYYIVLEVDLDIQLDMLDGQVEITMS